jgi:alkanesulfonate monooxygenase
VQKANSDPESVMAKTIARFPRVGSNGGTGAGLVGSYDQVAAHIKAFNQAGIETFMLQFQPFEAEMRRFAAEIMPRVRRE